MSQDRLNIKHIAPYLPYGLKVQYEGIINGNDIKQWEKDFPNFGEIDGVVGIVELAKILSPKLHWVLNKLNAEDGICSAKAVNADGNVELYFMEYFCNFGLSKNNIDLIIKDPIGLFAYLFQHHYDIYRLIDKGLAIDINTIDNGKSL